jgi:hypothetical protein
MRKLFPQLTSTSVYNALIVASLLAAGQVMAQPTGQWDFTNSDLTATVGTDLSYADGTGGLTQMGTAFGTTATFGIPNINGTAAKVMQFPAATNGMGFFMPTPAANGSGSFVNDYTLILDLFYPNASDSKIRPIIDTDGATFIPGPEFIVNSSDAIGIAPGGPFAGTIAPNTWNRIGFVVKQEQNLIILYVNGARVGTETISGSQGGTDGRFALSPNSVALILGSTDTNAALGYVSSIQIRDVALATGQMKALGGASASKIPQVIPQVPSFIDTRIPDANDVGVAPEPNIHVIIDQGDTIVDANSIKLFMDRQLLPASLAATAPTFTLDYAVTSILRPLSPHLIDLVYSDSVAGLQTNSWTFTIANYQRVFLPQPIYSETFDELAEGDLPASWSVTNNTVPQTAGFDLNVPKSDAYKDFVVISSNRLFSVFTEHGTYSSPGLGSASGLRRLVHPPIVLNGVLLDSLVHGNLAYVDSDQRTDSGGQVNVMFTSDYDLTGQSNVYLAFKSTYEQNQDNLGSVEYSIDQGQTWLPALYMLDDGTTDGDGSDVVINSSTQQIDVFATFGTPRSDQAYGLAYSNYIGAVVSTNLIPYISGRRNDDSLSSKRIEVLRLAKADNQSHVRFRFGQAGTSSWYFGIDDFGLYSINTPVISAQPASVTVDANTPATFTVTASGSGTLAYQWEFNGNSIANATNSSYTVQNAQPSDAGLYDVVVSNSDGPTTSTTVQLTVITGAQFVSQPVSQVADPGDSVMVTSTYRGGRPIGSYWLLNGAVAANSFTNDVVNTLVLASVTTANSGTYRLVVTNSYGAITSGVAQVTVFSGSITNGLVVHLTFDGNLNDTSGRGNNATYATNGANADANPTFIAGKIGQAFEFTTWTNGSKIDYATLGYPADLQFGDSNAVSISFWINYTNQSDDLPFISNKDWNSSGNVGWGIFAQSPGDFRVNFTGPNGGTDKLDYHPNNVLRDGAWHNVVLSISRAPGTQAANVYTYVDGAPLAVRTMVIQGTIDTVGLPFTNEQNGGNPSPTSQSDWAVNIGQDGTGAYHDQGGAYNLAAHIDDVGIWRRALTPKEANGIYTAGQAGKDLSQAVVVAVLPPAISSDPVSQVVSAGANVLLSVQGSGPAPLSFSWLKNGATIQNASSSNLTLNAVTAADQGAYAAVLSNPGGSITSRVAQLVVFSGSITQGLVVHLKFDGDYKDASGNALDGSAVGSPGFQTGIIGQAVHVNSAGTPADNPSPNNYVSLGTQLKLGTNDFSIGFWAKIASQNDDKPFISNKDWNSGSNPGWAIATEGDGMKWNFKDDLSSRRDSDDFAPQLEDGNWHHVLVTFFRTSSGTIYVDGQPLDVSNLAPDPGKVVGTADSTLPINVGQDGTGHYTDHGGAAAVDMLVDDLGIWQRVVTASEAQAVYAAGQAGKDLSQAQVSSIPSRPTLVISVSGGNVHLSWQGSATAKLQTNSSLNPATWTDVPNTTGASSATVPISGTSAFFRVAQ